MILRRTLMVVTCLGAIAMVLLAIAGGVVNFSRVPFWDMWNGSVGFVQRFEESPLTSIFSQHNEHRIFLSRIAFFAEYKIFDGSNRFLVSLNYILVAMAALVFSACVYFLNRENTNRIYLAVFSLAVTGWLFLWSQHENLTWGFQSQFFLAQLLPLVSFLFLGASADRHRFQWRYFWSAVALGAISSGTMANGLATLPLMTVGALVWRMGLLRTAILLGASVAVVTIYFIDYEAPAHHGSVLGSLLSSPVEMMMFTFSYVGSPFFYIFGGTALAATIAEFAGAVFVVLAVSVACLNVRKAPLHWVVFGLILFIAYVGASAFVTAGGRVFLTSAAGFSSRYTTPALMGWAALFVILSPSIFEFLRRQAKWRIPALAAASCAMLFLASYQLIALSPLNQNKHLRKVAILAAELGVPDAVYLNEIFFHLPGLLNVTEWASENDMTVFGLEPFKDLRNKIGEPASYSEAKDCPATFEAMEPIPGVNNFVRIHGWQFDPQSASKSKGIGIVNQDGILVGYAVTGSRRSDVAAAYGENATNAGFTGYLLSSAINQTLIATDGNCQSAGSFNKAIYEKLALPAGLDSVTLDMGRVESSENWNGSDFYTSELDGLEVLGSYINSDADTGKIRFAVRPGDQILYRSGPSTDRQIIRLSDTGQASQLPESIDWTVLQLLPETTSDDLVSVEIEDAGNGWGEWSAVALREPAGSQGQE